MSLDELKTNLELPRLIEARSRIDPEALGGAGGYFAQQAELLAWQIEHGVVTDHGSADALRLLAAVMRSEG